MRSCPDPLQQIRVILLDSGCTDQAAEEFLQYWQNGDPAAWRQFLQAHRQQLLENLHADKLRIGPVTRFALRCSVFRTNPCV